MYEDGYAYNYDVNHVLVLLRGFECFGLVDLPLFLYTLALVLNAFKVSVVVVMAL